MNDLFEKSIHVIELPKVLERLAQHAFSDRAKQMCAALRPLPSLYECEKLLQETADAVMLAGMFGSPGFSGLKDISAALDRLDKGGVLNMAELLDLAGLLRCARVTRDYASERKGQRTALDERFSALAGNKYLEDRITSCIISPEEMADSASSELYQIRRQIRTAGSKVRDVLAGITGSVTYSKMLQDNIVTQRGGRFVVPVKAEYRASFGGLVHDISSSGATLFIEPAAVVELNNNIRVLSAKEQAEIERILGELSLEAGQFAGQTMRDYELLCALDFIFARAKLAYSMEANRPQLCENGRTEIKRARHPLLSKDKAVPISFFIGGKTDTVVITGPNTGGKTVSIKTLGLLTVMAQCGLFIPASEESRISLCEEIYADIGDEQSIEQSLSTFSSHMRTIVDICRNAKKGTLVLLDELGAGTDPVEGAALAVAVIEQLRAQGARVAATTHYAELKVYALETDGVENASCEFDVSTLMPTYKLVFGVPGKSNAFAISRRLGLPENIITAADSRIDNSSRRFEAVIASLDEKRQALESRIDTAEKQKRRAEELLREAEEKLRTVDSEREKLLQNARNDAKEIIHNARAAADMTLNDARKIKEQAKKGEDANLSAARAAMRGKLNEAESKLHDTKPVRKAEPLPRALVAGDEVEIVSTGTKATVLEAPKGNDVRLQAGIMKLTVKLDDLRLIDTRFEKKKQELKHVTKTPPAQAVASSIDVRGQTADEAIMEIERYIDNAFRLHLESVTIIHGKGTGVLRQKIQSWLRLCKQVKSFRNGLYGEGEMGVTVVSLK